MDLRCKPRKDKCCIYLPEIPQTERKGPKDRRKSARRPGLRIPGLIQKIGMVNVHLAVHKHICSIGRAFDFESKGCRFESGRCTKAKECTASGKKINLLFWNMNTHESRKPTCEKVSSKCNSRRRQSLNPARKNVPKGNL